MNGLKLGRGWGLGHTGRDDRRFKLQARALEPIGWQVWVAVGAYAGSCFELEAEGRFRPVAGYRKIPLCQVVAL